MTLNKQLILRALKTKIGNEELLKVRTKEDTDIFFKLSRVKVSNEGYFMTITNCDYSIYFMIPYDDIKSIVIANTGIVIFMLND